MRFGVTLGTLAAALVTPVVASAQQWNDPRVLQLVRQATENRARQLADSGLVDYYAKGHGYLTFLAQIGEGFPEPPKVVKADELALEIFWKAPNLSKQLIAGRRDTTLLPTDIEYHRDHLGIVQNNFPSIIRLGDGDEVRDVPHPLSATGNREYDFALSDSLRITIPGRTISVYEVKVRPKNDRLPRVIGALYLDRDNAQVVRMALSFTRAAFLDRQLEDLFIVLENGLVGTRFWLPRRQEIEIRRTATWMDYPVRGIIRGRWEISDYGLNVGLPLAQFAGDEIVAAPLAERRAYPWPKTSILDSLPPDIRAPTAAEIRRVQNEVRTLVREQALTRARGSALAARGISDFVRYNRAEGLAFGFGLAARLGRGVSISGTARYGLEDDQEKGRATIRWQDARGRAVRLFAERDLRDVGEVRERSLFVNSVAAQEMGSDFTDPVDQESWGAAVTLPLLGITWTLEGAQERHRPAPVRASPAWGRFEDVLPAVRIAGFRTRLIADRPTRLSVGGLELRARGEASVMQSRVRASLDLDLQRDVGARARFVSRTIAGVVHAEGAIPVQELVFFGGPVTAPGYDFHALAGEAALSQRVELRFPVPFPSVSLGRFGRSGASATLAPFATAVALGSPGAVSTAPGAPPFAGRLRWPRDGVYPSVGAGLHVFFDLLRLDVARGLRDGRWSFYLDVNRSFWSVL